MASAPTDRPTLFGFTPLAPNHRRASLPCSGDGRSFADGQAWTTEFPLMLVGVLGCVTFAGSLGEVGRRWGLRLRESG